MLKLKHSVGKNQRPYTILISCDGRRSASTFDVIQINLALTLARDDATKLAERYGLSSYRSLLQISDDWEIDIY